MSAKRLRVVLEFNQNKEDEMELYDKLNKFSSPASYVKDVLKGVMPPLYPVDYEVYISTLKFEEFDE